MSTSRGAGGQTKTSDQKWPLWLSVTRSSETEETEEIEGGTDESDKSDKEDDGRDTEMETVGMLSSSMM